MKIRIGSRKSKLAVTQAESVGQELKSKNPGLEIEFVGLTTTGDRDAHSALKDLGGKGVFVKEIEEALLKKEIDLAVHSLKDVPQQLPAGLILGPFPKREDPRDAALSRFGELLGELPRSSTIGTSSPRREAQILNKYKKKYRVAPIRGNVDTRLRKLEAGEFDLIIMAVAGLKRLGLEKEITHILEPDEMIPAPGQGCLGLEVREDRADLLKILESIKDETSDLSARAERAFLQGIGGDCLIPLGAYTQVDKEIRMKAILADPKGTQVIRVEEKGPLNDVELVGSKLAGRLLYEGGSEIMLGLNNNHLIEDPSSRRKPGSRSST